MEHIFSWLNIGHLGANFNVFTGPKGLFAMLLALLVFLYGMSIGKTKALLSLLAMYAAFAITNLFPYLSQISTAAPFHLQPHFVRVFFFAAVYALVFFVLNMSSLKRLSMGELSLPKVFLVSIVQIGFFASLVASFIPQEPAMKLLGPLYPVIGSRLALFGWAVVSLAILPFIRHRRL